MRMGTYVLVNSIGDLVVSFRGALVRDLAARGHRVVVSTTLPEEIAAERVRAELAALGAETDFAPYTRASMHPLGEWRARRHYHTLFARLAPDGVFAANPKPVFHAIPAAAARHVPRRVAMITGLGYAFIGTSMKARLARVVATRLYRGAIRSATTLFFQNEDDRLEFARRDLLVDARDVRMCAGSGVDLDRFAAVDPPAGPPVFTMVARLLADKGVREFAQAARMVRARRPDVRFRLVGWIDANPTAIARAELDAWVREGIVEFAGRVDDPRAELAAASVFVLPSYREGTPKAALEALAIGRAIVTTDVPGCRATVEHGVNGLLVAPRDANAIAEACLALAGNPARIAVMGVASRRKATEFDVRRVNAAIIDALGA
ncbi:MAG: glycosyltransferase family 4 protein [bacterium]